MDKILHCIARAEAEGGKVLVGGKRHQVEGRCAEGWFVQPTVIEGLKNDAVTNQEEIFGPVVTIMPFSSEDDVIGWANDCHYGLSATLWTENLSRAHRLSAKMESGIVWVNCWLKRDLRTPFGGMKDSGVGREGGFAAMRFFTEAKNVCIDYAGENS
jgi:aminomuconate-semialdehyde/2-hydroxymuconate-6-semialdehyde dehydrogenase